MGRSAQQLRARDQDLLLSSPTRRRNVLLRLIVYVTPSGSRNIFVFGLSRHLFACSWERLVRKECGGGAVRSSGRELVAWRHTSVRCGLCCVEV